MTSFWVGEYGPAEIATAPEFAVADGIVSRSTRREAERAIRHLQVLNCPAHADRAQDPREQT